MFINLRTILDVMTPNFMINLFPIWKSNSNYETLCTFFRLNSAFEMWNRNHWMIPIPISCQRRWILFNYSLSTSLSSIKFPKNKPSWLRRRPTQVEDVDRSALAKMILEVLKRNFRMKLTLAQIHAECPSMKWNMILMRMISAENVM